MTFSCHLKMLIILSVLFLTNPSSGNYVSCPQAEAGIPRNETKDYCLGPHKVDLVYNPCSVSDFIDHLHQEIQKTLVFECNTEITVQRQELEFEEKKGIAIMNGEKVPPMPQLSPEATNIMARLKPQQYGNAEDATGTGPQRTDQCLNDHVYSELKAMAKNRCNSEDILQICTAAMVTAKKDSDKADQSLEEAKKLSPKAAIAYAESHLKALKIKLASLAENNHACVNAVVSIQDKGCLTVYQDFFGDSHRMDLLRKYCTHAGVQNSIREFSDWMNNGNSPARKMRLLSRQHIMAREKETQLAVEFDELSKYLEKLKNPTNSRQMANDTGT